MQFHNVHSMSVWSAWWSQEIDISVIISLLITSLAVLWALLFGTSLCVQDDDEFACVNEAFECDESYGEPHLTGTRHRHVTCGCPGYVTYIRNNLVSITARHTKVWSDVTSITEVNQSNVFLVTTFSNE